MCLALIVGFARSSNNVQVKRTLMLAYQIKTRNVFPPRNRQQVGAMVWLVWIKISRMKHLSFEMFRTSYKSNATKLSWFVYFEQQQTFH